MNGIMFPGDITHVPTSDGGFVAVGHFPSNPGTKVAVILDLTQVEGKVPDVAEIHENATCANCTTRSSNPDGCLHPDDFEGLKMGDHDGYFARLKSRRERFCTGHSSAS